MTVNIVCISRDVKCCNNQTSFSLNIKQTYFQFFIYFWLWCHYKRIAISVNPRKLTTNNTFMSPSFIMKSWPLIIRKHMYTVGLRKTKLSFFLTKTQIRFVFIATALNKSASIKTLLLTNCEKHNGIFCLLLDVNYNPFWYLSVESILIWLICYL